MQLDILGLAISGFLAVFSALLVTSVTWPLICLPVELIARVRYGVHPRSAWLNIYLGAAPRPDPVVSSTTDQL